MTIGKATKGQTINDQRKSYKMTENTMTNGKSYKRTYNTMTNGKVTIEQTIQCPTEKLQKDREYNDHRKSYKRIDNTMTKGKTTKEQIIQ
jgi:hypothetical protein